VTSSWVFILQLSQWCTVQQTSDLQTTCSTMPIYLISQNKTMPYLYRFTANFVVYLSNTPTNAHIQSFNNVKFALKHLKRSNMFRSYDHPQGAYSVPC